MKIYLHHKYFMVLHYRIEQRYIKECNQKGTVPETNVHNKYGYKKNGTALKPAEHSIADSIRQNSNIPKCYEKQGVDAQKIDHYLSDFNGKYLYERFRKAQRGNTVFFSQPPYNTIFFYHVGVGNKLAQSGQQESHLYELVKQFIDSLSLSEQQKFKISKKDTKQQIEMLNSAVSPAKATAYSCYFYSFRMHTIKEFKLKLYYPNFGNSSTKPYKARCNGLQNRDNSDEWYTGKALEANGYLQIQMHNKYNNSLNIIGYVGGGNKAKNKSMILASFQTISKYNYIINGECILIKKTNVPLTTIQDLQLQTYLLLKRSAFRVPERIYENVSELKVNRTRMDKLTDIAGKYHLVYYDQSQDGYVQGRLQIHSNYKATLDTAIHKNQVCLLNFYSETAPNKLFISTHPDEGIGVLGYIIIDFGRNLLNGSSQQLFMGSYCTFNRRLNLVAGKAVFRLATNSNNPPAHLGTLNNTQISDSPILQEMTEQLRY